MLLSVTASEAKPSSRFVKPLDGFASLATTLLLAIGLMIAGLSASAIAAGPAELISQFRAQHGEGGVTLDPTLTGIAQHQAAAMAAKETLDHDVAGSFTSRVAKSNAGRAAENIAYGYPDFPSTLKQWINSPSHRRNLLLKGASKVGIASVKSASGRTYWSMEIAGDYDKPKPKPKAKPKDKPAQAAAAHAKSKPKPAAKRDCTISLLGLCI
jgi:uncharacterized protein YkwD